MITAYQVVMAVVGLFDEVFIESEQATCCASEFTDQDLQGIYPTTIYCVDNDMNGKRYLFMEVGNEQ